MNSKTLNKEESIKLMKTGFTLKQVKTPDFGTTSLTKPIKRTGKFTSKFTIDNISVSTKSGYSIISKDATLISSQRLGLCEINFWKLK